MNEQANIQKLINNFVADLQSIFQRSAIAALTHVVGNGKAKLNGNGAQVRGGKRSSEDLERLSAAFVTCVSKNPGLCVEQINKEIGATTKDLALPIRKLIVEKRIKVKGKRRATVYFAA